MIGKINSHLREATVIGGGICGLVAAFLLDEKGYSVELFEGTDRLGGVLETQLTDHGIAESAAHSILVTPTVEALFKRLGIDLLNVNPSSQARWILRDGKMRRFPLTLTELFSLAVRASWVPALSSKRAIHLSMEEWAVRHLGQPALEYLINPMLRGVYGASPEEILVSAAFPSLIIPPGHSLLSHRLNEARKHLQSGQPKTKRRMASPRGGMSAITQAISKQLEHRLGSRIHLGCKLAELPDKKNIVLAVPPHEAAQLLLKADPGLAKQLSTVKTTPLVTVTVFLKKNAFQKIPTGIGILVPRIEKREILGILFNSSAFEGRVKDPSAWSSLTCMLGGSSDDEILHASESEIIKKIERELLFLFGYREPIQHYRMKRWPHAIPQYNHTLVNTWKVAKTGWCAKPGRIIAGNYTGDLSIRGMIESMTEALL